MSEIDWVAIRAQAELETIAEKTKEILEDPDGYECSACCIEGQPCDVGLAVKVERERIIKLLEELDDEEWMGINQNFIALIKGESQKDNETVVLLTERDYDQLSDAIKGEK